MELTRFRGHPSRGKTLSPESPRGETQYAPEFHTEPVALYRTSGRSLHGWLTGPREVLPLHTGGGGQLPGTDAVSPPRRGTRGAELTRATIALGSENPLLTAGGVSAYCS